MSKMIDTKGALNTIFCLLPGHTKDGSITDQYVKGARLNQLKQDEINITIKYII